MICENCNKAYDNVYSSGRFCSCKCARSFSTKNNRKEINKKISNSLKGKKITVQRGKIKQYETVICKTCGKSFEKIVNYKKNYCSAYCAVRSKKPNNGGLRDGGGHSKILSYESKIAGNVRLNKEEIEIAKIFDKLNIKWIRNKNGFPYTTLEGKQRKYYPDFYLEDYGLYVEYKGWVTYEMSHKMEQSKKQNNFKLLIIYGKDKRFSKLGLNLQQIQDNNELLLDCLEA